MINLPATKPLEWIGNSRRVLQTFPKPVRQVVGQALYAAQIGDKHIDTKPLKGFGGLASWKSFLIMTEILSELFIP
jgi:phage-related protein